MGEAATKRFETPDETRELEHGRIDIVHLAGSTAAHVTFEPGWRWATTSSRSSAPTPAKPTTSALRLGQLARRHR
jgi:hypothetical protein